MSTTTELIVRIRLRGDAPAEDQRAAAAAELRTLLKMFRRQPFATTSGTHASIYIVDVVPVVEDPPT